MAYDVRIENFTQPRPLLVVRRVAEAAELSRVVPECCGMVWKVVKAQGIAGAGRHVAVYLDGEINVDVGVELDRPASGARDVVGSALPIGATATATHFGPYPKLGEAHRAILDWCKVNGRKLAGPSWEIYGHWDQAWNADPSKIRTDVYYLLDDSPSASAAE